MNKKLGAKKAQKVLMAFAANPQHFGFIKITEKELAELESLYSPPWMNHYTDVFSFRAGMWVVMIVDHSNYLEFYLINPYDPKEQFFAYSC